MSSSSRRRTGRRAWRAFRELPAGVQAFAAVLVLLLTWLAANTLVQVARKPTELFFPVSGALDKTPAQTWESYAPIFRAHATRVLTPEFLAALAQVEGAGNPVARTGWRWRLTENPFEVYRPASSAVGMYQITDGAFALARRYCIHDHEVALDGPWYAWRSCWFNWLYFRVVPSHAAEMTSAFLGASVSQALQRLRIAGATPAEQRDLAAVMHLCGVAASEGFAARGFRAAALPRCGGQDVRGYLERMRAMQREFERLARYARHGVAAARHWRAAGAHATLAASWRMPCKLPAADCSRPARRCGSAWRERSRATRPSRSASSCRFPRAGAPT